jgi:hypothetical protein
MEVKQTSLTYSLKFDVTLRYIPLFEVEHFTLFTRFGKVRNI